MAQRNPNAFDEGSENILSFVRPSVHGSGVAALELVYQAAEVFSRIEDHARETEARARSMCRSAAERLKHAESQVETAEQVRRELITKFECKLQDASRVLRQVQSRVDATEDKLVAMEFRAQTAEAEAREAKEALARVEQAIRKRLLCATSEVDTALGATA